MSINLGGSLSLDCCQFPNYHLLRVLQERTPPSVDDFLYICDDAYAREELLEMEISVLKTIGFDLGMPLSYTFLRRYAQVLYLATNFNVSYYIYTKRFSVFVDTTIPLLQKANI